MGLQDEIEFDGKNKQQQGRQYGFFIGCNFFLRGELECRKMWDLYRELIINRKNTLREDSRQRKHRSIERELL